MFKDDPLAFKMFTNCPVELSIKKLFSLPKKINLAKKKPQKMKECIHKSGFLKV